MPNYKKRLEKWITALESGEFEQATGDLCTYSNKIKKKTQTIIHWTLMTKLLVIAALE